MPQESLGRKEAKTKQGNEDRIELDAIGSAIKSDRGRHHVDYAGQEQCQLL